MANINVTRQGPEAQLDRELPFDERLGRNVVEVDPWRAAPARKAPELYAAGLVLGLTWLAVLIIVGLFRAALCWGWAGCASLEAQIANLLLWVWLALPVASGLAGICVWLWGFVARTRAETARMALTRDRWGSPVSAETIVQQTPAQALEAFRLAADAEVRMAPHRAFRGVDALTLTNSAPQLAAAASPAQIAGVLMERPSDWLGWLKERPHLLLAAESGAGKSVLANVVMKLLLTPGATAAIIDCHWSPRVASDEGRLVAKWGGIPPTATTYAAARATLGALRAEYDQRMRQLQAGEVLEGRFPPILILVDETPELVRELAKLDRVEVEAKRAPRGTSTWDDSMVILGSGGRKVNMHGHLLAQSPLVEDIGMNSAMRKNFFRIALAHAECRRLIAEEPDKARRDALLDALKGRRYPAAVERNGEVWLLSRDGLLELMPEQIDAPRWEPAPLVLGPSETAENPQNRPFSADLPQTDGADTLLATLRFLRSKGVSRDGARAMGLEFDNELWSVAGRSADGADG